MLCFLSQGCFVHTGFSYRLQRSLRFVVATRRRVLAKVLRVLSGSGSQWCFLAGRPGGPQAGRSTAPRDVVRSAETNVLPKMPSDVDLPLLGLFRKFEKWRRSMLLTSHRMALWSLSRIRKTSKTTLPSWSDSYTSVEIAKTLYCFWQLGWRSV